MALRSQRRSGAALRVLVIGPPTTAVGGVSTYIRTIQSSVDHAYTHVEVWPRGRQQGTAWGWKGIVFHLGLIRRVARGVITTDVTHVMVTSAPAALMRETVIAVVSRLLGAGVVCHYHGGRFLEHASRSRLYRSVLRLSLRACCVAVMLSEQMRAELGTLGGGLDTPALVVPNPVDDAFFAVGDGRDYSRAPMVVLCMGEVSRRKGQLALMRAVESLAGRCRLVLAGPIEASVHDNFEDALADARQTEYLGSLDRDECLAAYGDADAYCLNSSAEGLPISILEAMAAGLPVIATDVGSISDVVGEQTGHLVANGDDAGLSRALTRLSEDVAHRRACGLNARSLARSFGRAEHLARLADAYEIALGRRATAGR